MSNDALPPEEIARLENPEPPKSWQTHRPVPKPFCTKLALNKVTLAVALVACAVAWLLLRGPYWSYHVEIIELSASAQSPLLQYYMAEQTDKKFNREGNWRGELVAALPAGGEKWHCVFKRRVWFKSKIEPLDMAEFDRAWKAESAWREKYPSK